MVLSFCTKYFSPLTFNMDLTTPKPNLFIVSLSLSLVRPCQQNPQIPCLKRSNRVSSLTKSWTMTSMLIDSGQRTTGAIGGHWGLLQRLWRLLNANRLATIKWRRRCGIAWYGDLGTNHGFDCVVNFLMIFVGLRDGSIRGTRWWRYYADWVRCLWKWCDDVLLRWCSVIVWLLLYACCDGTGGAMQPWARYPSIDGINS